MKEKVYEVRMCGMVIVAFNNRDEADLKASILNHMYGTDDYYVVEVEKDSLQQTSRAGAQIPGGEEITMEELIAVADFKVNGTANKQEFKNHPIHMELRKSGAFAYGNQTVVIVEIPGQMTDDLDTRYDHTLKKDGSNFKAWATNYLKGWLADGLTVTEAK